jgi:hypothetical protein
MTTTVKPLRIDIPVRLNELRITFSIADLAFEGDLPAAIFHMQLITTNIADWNAKAEVIAVFHTRPVTQRYTTTPITLNERSRLVIRTGTRRRPDEGRCGSGIVWRDCDRSQLGQ